MNRYPNILQFQAMLEEFELYLKIDSQSRIESLALLIIDSEKSDRFLTLRSRVASGHSRKVVCPDMSSSGRTIRRFIADIVDKKHKNDNRFSISDIDFELKQYLGVVAPISTPRIDIKVRKAALEVPLCSFSHLCKGVNRTMRCE